MASFDKLHIESAVQAHDSYNLDFPVLTTFNFGEVVPTLSLENVPSDKFKVGINSFSRVAPMVVPTYGKAWLNHVSFYVPYYQVADDADAYINNNAYLNSRPTGGRYITLLELGYFFLKPDISVSATEDSFHFKYKNSSGTLTYKKFTKFGRYCYKCLRNLGFKIPSNISTASGTDFQRRGTKKLNIYPLLTFFKAYNDWMSQSQKYNTSQLSFWLDMIRQNSNIYLPSSQSEYYYNAGQRTITADFLVLLFKQIYLMYESNIFTSAWKYPNSPIDITDEGGLRQKSLSYLDSDGVAKRIEQSEYDNFSTPSSTTLSARAIEFLDSFTRYINRKNYAGSRVVQQILARFGIKTQDFRANYAHIIDSSKEILQVGDVTSTAQVSGSEQNAQLGSYAGKGIIAGSSGFSHDSDDYGQLIVISFISVDAIYSDGFDRSVLRSEPFDFFQPEFDALGPQAISIQEVSEVNKSDDETMKSDTVFGFTERYNEYKTKLGVISGDFCLFDEFKTWHFGRDLSDVRNAGELYAQSPSVVRVDNVDSEYNRIFSITNDDYDKFYIQINFKVSANRPMKNLSASTSLGQGGLQISRNGSEVK